jgi:glycine cleavage system H protein
MNFPADLKYTDKDEWARVDAPGSVAWIGITAHAVEQLSDLVFLDLPEVGKDIQQGEVFGEIESVKAVADLYAPVTGEVLERNDALIEDLSILKSDPYGKGWMLKIRMEKVSEQDGLLSPAAYQKSVNDRSAGH